MQQCNQTTELKRNENMKYKPSRDLPEFVREYKTLSPSKLATIILNKRNEKKTEESITMWFKRHREVHDQLRKEIIQGLPSKKEKVDSSIFDKGSFEELPSVKNWIKTLSNRNAKESTIQHFVGLLKRVCKGELQKGVFIYAWVLKHPDRLTLEDAKDFIFEVKKRRLRSREWRLALRNFLKSKGIVVETSDVSGELEDDAGQYADLYVSKEKIYEILAWLKERNCEAYLASKFAYKTASRLTATLGAWASFINHEEHTITIFEKSIKGKAKRKLEKWLSEDLYDELPKKGRLFDIKSRNLNKFLRQAYKEIIPEVAERIPMPFHFWRHMFAQHMLRACQWNYGLVASLGHWSLETLRRYYGMPPQEVIKQFGMETLPKI